jgi:hypothetical protein
LRSSPEPPRASVAPLVGYWLDWSRGAYAPLFVICGSIYLVAFAVIHWLVPRD